MVRLFAFVIFVVLSFITIAAFLYGSNLLAVGQQGSGLFIVGSYAAAFFVGLFALISLLVVFTGTGREERPSFGYDDFEMSRHKQDESRKTKFRYHDVSDAHRRPSRRRKWTAGRVLFKIIDEVWDIID